jgi:hypothetical protein
MTAPRYLRLLTPLKSGPMTSLEIAALTNISRLQVTNGLCALFNDGYLIKTKAPNGRTLYALRPNVAVPEIPNPSQFTPKVPQQTWFSAII